MYFLPTKKFTERILLIIFLGVVVYGFYTISINLDKRNDDDLITNTIGKISNAIYLL